MSIARGLSAEIAIQVKTLLTDMISQADAATPPVTGRVHAPAPVPGIVEPGWHPYSPSAMPDQNERSGYPIWQQWAQLRLIETTAAGPLVVVLLADRDGNEIYVYSEDTATYEDLFGGNDDADASFVARLIVAHLDEQMGGAGWQQGADRARIGRITILTDQAEAQQRRL